MYEILPLRNSSVIDYDKKSIQAMLIPAKEEVKPLWFNACHVTYNGDGTATFLTGYGQETGRIGIDFLLCYGISNSAKPMISILERYEDSYEYFVICDQKGNDICRLSELYPA